MVACLKTEGAVTARKLKRASGNPFLRIENRQPILVAGFGYETHLVECALYIAQKSLSSLPPFICSDSLSLCRFSDSKTHPFAHTVE